MIEKLNPVVATLCENRLRPSRMTPFAPTVRPANLTEAYDVQEDLQVALTSAGLGARQGFKIGCTTPVMQSFMNINHPCAGSVMAECIYRDHGEFEYSDFAAPGVECEIAVRLGADLAANDAPFNRTTVADAVAAVMPGIEVVDDRYDDFRRFDLETLVADDFFQAACVLGGENTRWQDLDLAALPGRMLVNDVVTGEGLGADILGHPLEALAWLANLRAERGLGLDAGQIVMLGSVVQTHWLAPGDRIDIVIEGLGIASAEFLATTGAPT